MSEAAREQGGGGQVEGSEAVREAVLEVVLEIVRRTRPETNRFDSSETLGADLGLDSLDLAEIVATLERRVGKDPFAERTVGSVRTVQDLVDAYVAASAASQG